jgi:hypothetical protein
VREGDYEWVNDELKPGRKLRGDGTRKYEYRTEDGDGRMKCQGEDNRFSDLLRLISSRFI